MASPDVFQRRCDELEASFHADLEANRRVLETLYHVPVLPRWQEHLLVACYAAPLVLYILALVLYG